ncbi:hypothetical protein RBSWK_04166 [Rhodopirellula baltica SWK14]|uniref:Uncharacterized protein n=1 Tax=Rhodopirellula baltica SWK14 TaxID=993516 RepID=L7CG31_RHOBT|nr:hypothetical protein RBSWK_04166 [Rhodopirellula baltica SWK14]
MSYCDDINRLIELYDGLPSPLESWTIEQIAKICLPTTTGASQWEPPFFVRRNDSAFF